MPIVKTVHVRDMCEDVRRVKRDVKTQRVHTVFEDLRFMK